MILPAKPSLSCIVIDDQPEAIALLKDHVQATPQLVLKATTTNPVEALAYLDAEKVDLIFVDIHMPEMSGLEFVESLREKWGVSMPKIIFTTGYDQYALSGFEHGVSDYLLKPISYKRFKTAIDRILNDRSHPAPASPQHEFFFADVDGKKVKIGFEEIIYVEGARNYVFIVTPSKKMITYKSMTALMGILPEEKFVRLHKSFIASVEKITAVRGNEVGVTLNGEEKYIPIGATYKSDVFKKLGIVE